MNKTFCVFIMSHGRPDKIYTLNSLVKCGFIGEWFIVIDNEDKHAEEYKLKYGKRVLQFDKLAMAKRCQNADNFENRKVILYARNACFDFAESFGYEYFLQLDDDYVEFEYTYNIRGEYERKRIMGLQRIVKSFCKYLDANERIASVAFLQGGDFIGGGKCTTVIRGHYPFKKRKAMNSFFCKTSRRFWFSGRINEDVNTYLSLGSRGMIFMSIPLVILHQKQSQSNSGGMTETYIVNGTYIKSFYSVIFAPSACKVEMSKDMHRLHHRIKWSNAVPKILDDTHKKP